MKLFIDTTSNSIIKVGLQIHGVLDMQEVSHEVKKAQIVLPLIDELLKKHGLTSSDLTEIDVLTGPGSFTGLRVGVAIANTLAAVLHIPVNGKKNGELVEPVYQ